MAKIVLKTDSEKKSLTRKEMAQEAARIVQVEARKTAYPSMEEQMDMQYWDGINGTTNWKDTIAKIKADYSLDEDGEYVSAETFPDNPENKGKAKDTEPTEFPEPDDPDVWPNG